MLFFFLSFAFFRENLPLAISRSFTPLTVQTNFNSEINVRLIGFPKDIQQPLSVLLQSSTHKMFKANVINTSPEVHHTFTAQTESLKIEINQDSNIEKIVSEHFNKHKAKIAIYCILLQGEAPQRTSRIIYESQNFVILTFYSSELSGNVKQDYFIVSGEIINLLNVEFNHQLSFFPLSNFTNPNLSLFVTISDEERQQTYIDLIHKSVDDLANVTLYVIPYDIKSMNLICGLCEDSECVSEWLLKTPEFFASRLLKCDFHMVILPKECPVSFRYGTDKIAFAVEDDETGIKSAIKSSLFGIDVQTPDNPFEELIYRRNMLVKPLFDLVKNITTVIEGVQEVFRLGLEFTEQETLNAMDNMVQDFRSKQELLIERYLNGENVTDLYNETAKIVEDAWYVWSRISESVKLKRVCVSNQIDISKDPFFLTRPSVIAAGSIISSILIFIYVFKRMRPKTVVRIITTPSPLL